MARRDKRPNILWICTDEQRYDTIGTFGNAYIRTPNIDRLAAEGVSFMRTYCQSPVCTPSRASFLSGMYPSTIHACSNGNEYWAGNAVLVPQILQDAGYATGLSGKLHIAGAQGRIEPRGDDGYQVFHWSHGKKDLWPLGHEYAEWLVDCGVLSAEPGPDGRRSLQKRITPEYHQTTWCANEAIDFIEMEHDGPWLFSVNIHDPHFPLDPPDEYLGRYDASAMPPPLWRDSDRELHECLGPVDGFNTDADGKAELIGLHDSREMKARYYAMIELIDYNVGRMVDSLVRTGERENTVIIFTSDHGDMLGDHGLRKKGCRFYEGLVKVPLIISWPEQLMGGLMSNALVELMDLAPTIVELAAAEVPQKMQARSLLPILKGEKPLNSHRSFVSCEYYHALNNTIAGREGWPGNYASMICDGRYKLAVYHDREMGELYDLKNDPNEFVNLWHDPELQEVRLKLMKIGFDRLALSVDTGPRQTQNF